MNDDLTPQIPEVEPITNPPVPGPAPVTPKPKKGKKVLAIAGILILLIVSLAVAAFLFMQQSAKKTDNKKTSTVTAQVSEQFCYVRLSHLVCVDSAAANPVRYDLPEVQDSAITGLWQSPDQSRYLARVNKSGTAGSFWLLDGSLKNPKQITVQPGDTINQPTWSHDSKSLFMEVNPVGVDNARARHIYQYSLATGKTTKITTTRLNTSPYQLKDGKILYMSYSGTSDANGVYWAPYIMDADGSNPQPYATKLIDKNFLAMSYDLATNTVYLMSTSGTSDFAAGKVNYFPADDSTKAKFINDKVIGSFNVAANFYNDKILFGSGITATISEMATGKAVASISPFGTVSGMMRPTGVTKSEKQTEDQHERIIGLAKAPADFQTFIAQHFDAEAAKACQDPTAEYGITIYGVVREAFAQTSEGGCDGGSTFFYAKQADGTWVKLAATQMGVGCDVVNKYKFTKELITQCFDAKGNVVANTNT